MNNVNEIDTIKQTEDTVCVENSNASQPMNLNCVSSDLSVTNCVVSENIINDKSFVGNEKLKNILNKDIPLAPSLQEQVDEDDVLGGDETSSKEFDGNIDEDELLKDTEGDNNIKHTTENRSTFPKIFSPVENSKTLQREKLNGEDIERGSVSNVSDSNINNCSSLNETEKHLNTSSGEQNTVSKINLSSQNIDTSCIENGDPLEAGQSITDVSDSDGINRTEFLEIDQEAVQTETIELNDEDPFGQTNESKDKSIEMKDVEDNNTDQQDNKENKPNGESKVIETQKPVDDIKETDVNKPIPLSLENSNVFQNINNEKSDSKNVSKEPILNEKCPKASKNNNSSEDSDNDVCIIIPDSMQGPAAKKVQSVKNDIKVKVSENKVIQRTEESNKDRQKKKSEETNKTALKDKDSVEVQTPSRPQRKAAKKAESQIKQVLLDTDDGVLDDEDDADDDDVNLEEIQYDVDDDDLEVDEDADIRECTQCCKIKPCTINVITYGKTNYFCGENCFKLFRRGGSVVKDHPPLEEVSDISIPIQVLDDDDDDDESPVLEPESEVVHDLDNDEPLPNRTVSAEEFTRKCSQCSSKIISWDDKTLSWETMDFCNEDCLGKYQNELGSHCANCKGAVLAASLGKYCVRFGYDIKQFCCSTCLEEFKKGLKVCSFCQKDISNGAEGFLAPVGDKGQFKDFCTQACMEKYEQMSNNVAPPPQTHPCSVCNNNKIVQVEVLLDMNVNKMCSEVCFAAFKFVNNLKVEKCDMCKKYFDREGTERETFSVFYENAPHSFCCKTCMNVYILAKRKIVPCNWCKVKKYNFDMIKRVLNTGQAIMMCSLNCLTLYQVSINAVSSRRIKCDNCHVVSQAQYHLTMSDATIRNFCSYPCVMNFQGQYSKSPITLHGNEIQPIPTGLSVNPAALPVISSVTSLASNDSQKEGEHISPGTQIGINSTIAAHVGKIPYKQQIIIKPSSPMEVKNKQTQTRPNMHTKGVSCRPHPCAKETQTEDDLESTLKKPIFIPVPVPVYVPTPMAMFSLPFPVPVPFPLPVPVPIFVPTTRNSADGIFKEIKKIQEKMPTDPFEAELLMMAEMVAEEKKEAGSSSEGEDASEPVETSEPCGASGGESGFSPEAIESSNTFADDMLQMALKMASELEGPAVDLEAALTPATIAQPPPPAIEHPEGNDVGDDAEGTTSIRNTTDGRGRKRSNSRTSQRNSGNSNSSDGNAQKRSRRSSSGGDISQITTQRPSPPVPPVQPEEKPDANFRLKYTFGVNAWCQWVMTKNAELEKLSGNNRKLKLFKPEILQLTADELNYSLCLFIKEMKKPNGQEYAPDTIYYLCLGIQQYLFENGRIDNIFTDTYYEKFTDCLDEIAKKFTEIYDDRQYIVTRVEEEHLWESKQLGAHSPHVLLSTLMFFNTKHFNLTTVDEHMQLSFSHIMKHWKRNQNVTSSGGGLPKVPGSRNVLLRFYPPQTALESPNSRKKKVYEQQENEENPLRCPVKLYEFYLSKCPESVRSRSDVFYLQPERSCVPDSPVWYSTMALGKEPLSKMLHRVKMVKEINIALLST